jgi:hypothetical protein
MHSCWTTHSREEHFSTQEKELDGTRYAPNTIEKSTSDHQRNNDNTSSPPRGIKVRIKNTSGGRLGEQVPNTTDNKNRASR